MKIQLASDLHHEIWQRMGATANASLKFASEADVLLLAGDIGQVEDVIERYKQDGRPVLYNLGNHEFYGVEFADIRYKAKKLTEGTNVHFMDNTEVVIGGVRFLGATMWTDFKLDCTEREGMYMWETSLNDARYMVHNGQRVTAQKILNEHNRTIAWLRSRLETPFEGKTVVMGHHGCHPKGIDPHYANERNNSCFMSDLTPLVEMADAWVFGHTHASNEFSVGKCVVRSNPRGYPRPSMEQVLALRAGNLLAPALAQPMLAENPNFNPALIFEP